MSQYRIVRAAGLPDAPLAAADQFRAEAIPAIRAHIAEPADVVVAFDHADPSHDGWRLAVIRDLAREAAPARVNAVTGPPGDAMDEVCRFLAGAPGITGQIVKLDGVTGQGTLD